MRIPESWTDRQGNYTLYYERLESESIQDIIVAGQQIKILYEKPRCGFSYGSSPADIAYIFSKIDIQGFKFPKIVAFRQPSRNQTQQFPVWGRFIYSAEFGQVSGSAIILEAQEIGKKISWPRKLSHDSQTELKRLEADGHKFQRTKRAHIFTICEASLRKKILYRTLLHELGHYVHFQTDVTISESRLGKTPEDSENFYFAKPSMEKEKFAHRFADDLAETLRQNGVIPFSPKSNC